MPVGNEVSDPRLTSASVLASTSALASSSHSSTEQQDQTNSNQHVAIVSPTSSNPQRQLPFLSEKGRDNLLDMLSKPKPDLYVAKTFPSILIDLLYRVAVNSTQSAQSDDRPQKNNSNNATDNSSNVVANHNSLSQSIQTRELSVEAVKSQFRPFFLFCGLIGKCPQVTNFIYNYFEKSSFQPLPADLYTVVKLNTNSKGLCLELVYKQPGFDDNLMIEILVSYLTFLSYDSEFFSTIWNWSELGKLLLTHINDEIRYLSACALAIITKPTREQYQRFLRKHSLPISLQHKFNVIFDDKFYPMVETDLQPVTAFSKAFKGPTTYNYCDKDLANIVDVLIIKKKTRDSSEDVKKNEDYIKVSSLLNHLSTVAYSISIGKPCLIRGPVGSGKTALLDYIASQANRPEPPSFIRVQVGDQIDSKLLIGSYVCTELPGQFEWKPGPLALAISQGSWIVFEDIDFASSDMINVIHSVIENKSLESVSNCPMKLNLVHPDFRIFFTQRVTAYGRISSDMMKAGLGFIERICDVVDLPSLSDADLTEIINSRFGLKQISEKLVKIYNLTSASLSEVTVGSTRKISLRDLFKLCTRLQINNFATADLVLSQKELEGIFLDIIECLLRFLSQEPLIDIAYKIAAELNISQPEVIRLCIERSPSIGVSSDHVTIGRLTLRMSSKQSSTPSPIAYTRHSSCLMERIASSIKFGEAVLLVGETGVGKTTIVQHMAHLLNTKLVVINLSQQSDSSDLMGGFKPVELSHIIQPIVEELELLFHETFNATENVKFLGHISTCLNNHRWMPLLRIIQQLYFKAVKRPISPPMLQRWSNLQLKSDQLLKRLKLDTKRSPLALSFVEGSLMTAVTEGHWILLDEVNLAEAEVLQCLVAILDSIEKPYIHMCDPCNGPIRIKKHPGFRVFACMNPSTDVGKRDLTTGIRNRFTEIFFDDITSKSDLRLIVNSYLKDSGISSSQMNQLVEFYLQVREKSCNLSDTSGNSPNYSLRSLCRALHICSVNFCNSIEKSLLEALRITFLQQLNEFSKKMVTTMISATVFASRSSTSSLINLPIPVPKDNHTYINVEGYWIQQGSRSPESDQSYILTESVKKNLESLSRIISLGQRRLPILIQGQTSVGKTSLISYLAKLTGNQCHRLNNHEHTDLQEYLGGFVMNDQGSVEFQDGLLTHAMKRGHWIILDELNLAPCELLEALNRVLDDNRELFIPENRKTIKAHSKFMLFATQNPPQDYAGRKMLSRAFRNRFIELHFDEIPADELEIILAERCEMPPSYAKKILAVMKELQVLRRESEFFAGKHGFMTLRDLFRWGERYRTFKKGFESSLDWQKKLAEQGLTLLEGRVRTSGEAEIVLKTIEKIFQRKLDRDELYQVKIDTRQLPFRFAHLHMTHEFKRLYSQLSDALEHHEPVLLCGPTGCGKTTACQLYADQRNTALYIVNCHLNSEGSDFVGNMRPNRDDQSEISESKPLFQWVDGPLVKAMKEGAYFLIDEISLADDAVLERINSVLENDRTITLSEKGSMENVTVKALPGFKIIATMNPGGDHGKKELSPALRNRFTEIYCHSTTDLTEIGEVISHGLTLQVTQDKLCNSIIYVMKNFLKSFYQEFLKNTTHMTYSMRDIHSWIKFFNLTCSENHPKQLSVQKALYHGAALVFIDSIGTCGSNCIDLSTSSSISLEHRVKQLLKNCIASTLGTEPIYINDSSRTPTRNIQNPKHYINFGQFCIPMGPNKSQNLCCDFQFDVSTVKSNVIRIARAMQLDRPILLEGDPGVGKTSIISALAKISGNELIRINLSEQTDISDLFGSDLPAEKNDGNDPNFSWRDGPFLQALKESKWIMLDEMNLASQSVLEGLNACLDHRGTIYIPELSKEFKVNRKFTRIFACQNPHNQGSSRKGLPQSFVNRFSSIYIKGHTSEDLVGIVRQLYPQLPSDIVNKMVKFNTRMSELNQGSSKFGSSWEFNLRDLTYWCDLTTKYAVQTDVSTLDNAPIFRPTKFAQLVYLDRMRHASDRSTVNDLYKEVFGHNIPPVSAINIKFGDTSLIFGRAFLRRNTKLPPQLSESAMLKFQMQYIESIAKAIEMGKMPIIVGERGIGKRSMAKIVAGLAGYELNIISANSEMDVVELLGSFEQRNIQRKVTHIVDEIRQLVYDYINSYSDNSSARLFTQIFSHCWSLNYSTSIKEPQLDKSDLEQASAIKLDILKELMNIISAEQMPEVVRLNLERLRSSVEKLIKLSSKTCQSVSCNGDFEWIDSILVKSIKKGSWLMIENANVLDSSTLDRLNSLTETNGTLILNEKGANLDGQIECIQPHPNFRLILTMDPAHGELSRAMRNRGVEIHVEPVFHIEDFYRLLHKHGIRPIKNRACLPTAIWEACSKIDHALVGGDSDRQHLTKFMLQFDDSLTQHVCRGLSIEVALGTLLHRYYSRHGFLSDCSENPEIITQVEEAMAKAREEICVKVDDQYKYKNRWIDFDYDLAKYIGSDAIPTNIFRDAKLLDYSYIHLVNGDIIEADEHLNHGDLVGISAAIKIFMEQSSFEDLDARFDYLRNVGIPAVDAVITSHNRIYESFVPLLKATAINWSLPFAASEMYIDPRLCPEVHQVLLSSNMAEMVELEKSHNCWLISNHWLMLSLLVELIVAESMQLPNHESLLNISDMYKKGEIDKRDMFRPEIVHTITNIYQFLRNTIIRNINNRYYDNQMAPKMMHRLFWISYLLCKLTKHHTRLELIAICNQLPMLWALSYQKIILPIIRDCHINETFSGLYSICEQLGLDASMMQPIDKSLLRVAFNRFAASYSGQIDDLQRETSRFYSQLLTDFTNRSFSWSSSEYLDSIYAQNAKIAELQFLPAFHPEDTKNFSEVLKSSENVLKSLKDTYRSTLDDQKKDGSAVLSFSHYEQRRLLSETKFAPLWQIHYIHRHGCVALIEEDFEDYLHVLDNIILAVKGLYVSPIYHANILKFDIYMSRVDGEDVQAASEMSVVSAFILNHLQELRLFDIQVRHWLESVKSAEFIMSAPLVPEYSPILSVLCARNLNVKYLKFSSDMQITTHLRLLNEHLFGKYWSLMCEDSDIIDLKLANRWIISYEQQKSTETSSFDSEYPTDHIFKSFINSQMEASTRFFEHLDRLNKKHSDAAKAVKLVVFGYKVYTICAPLYPMDPALRMREMLEIYKSELSHLKIERALREVDYYRKTGHNMCKDDINLPFSTKIVIERCKTLEEKISKLQSSYTNRPHNDCGSQYRDLKLYIENFLNRVGSKDNIMDTLINRAFSLFEEDFTADSFKLFNRQCLNLMKTIQNCIDHLKSSFSLYTDLTNNFLTGVSFTLQGLKLLRVSIDGMIRAQEKKFKAASDTELQIVAMVGSISSDALEGGSALLLNQDNILKMCSPETALTTKSNLFKAAFYQINNQVMLSPKNAIEFLPLLIDILSQFHTNWMEDLRRKQEIRDRNEALYQFKPAKSALSSSSTPYSNKEFIELCTIFPTYDHCYKDIHEASDLPFKSELDNMLTEEKIIQLSKSINLTDCLDICKAHLKFIRISSQNLLNHCLPNNYSKKVLKDHAIHKILDLKSQALSELIRSNILTLTQRFDSRFLDFFILQTHALISTLDESKDPEIDNYDIYHHSNPKEVRRLQDFFDSLSKRLKELGKDLSNRDHLYLLSIIKLMHRIGSFLITDPLSKYMTGSHAILEYIEQWNSHVPSESKLTKEEASLIEIITSWRNLEMKTWRNSLKRVAKKTRDQALCHLWFNLYTAYDNPLECARVSLGNTFDEEAGMSEEEKVLIGFSTFLINFMDASKVGDYQIRLELLYAFTVQTKLVQLTGKASLVNYDKLIAISFNIFCLYSINFSQCGKFVDKETEQITKELNDAVTIVAWKNRHLWEVRNNLRVAQRKINTILTKYQNYLNQEVIATIPPNADTNAQLERLSSSQNLACSETVSHTIIGTSSLIKYTRSDISEEQGKCLTTHKLFKLAKSKPIVEKFVSLSRQIIEYINPKYPNAIYHFEEEIENLNEFMKKYHDQNIESVILLSKDSKEELSLKKKRIGQMVSTKNYMLRSIFKSLSSLGLSYRYGLKFENDYQTVMAAVEPLGSLLVNPGSRTLETANKAINIKLVEDCNHLYYHLMASNIDMLPQVDNTKLDSELTQRFLGYSIHLTWDICKHHKAISHSYRHMLNIQSIIVRLELLNRQASSSAEVPLLSFSATQSIVTRFDKISTSSISQLKALKAMLDSFRASDTMPESITKALSSDNSKSQFLSEEQMEKIKLVIDSKSDDFLRIKNQAHCMKENTSSNHFYSTDDTHALQKLIEEHIKHLECIGDIIMANDITQFNQSTNTVLHEIMSTTRASNQLKSELDQLISKSSHSIEKTVNPKLAKTVDKLVKKLMFIMQKLVEYEHSNEEDPKNEEKPIKQIDAVKVMQQLQLQSVDSLLSLSIDIINDHLEFSDLKPIIKGLTPLLFIYNNNVTTYMSVLLSSLHTKMFLACKVIPFFARILQKGLGLPTQYDDQDGQQNPEKLTDLTEAGFGEGCGDDDVSKRLEFESQLDELKSKMDGESDEKDDNIKSHEDGVEMSEDFEAQAHGADEERGDTVPPEMEEGSEEEQEEEMEGQMDEVDQNDEVLDENVWGQQDETEEEQLRDAPDEQGKQQTDESNMVAEDDSKRNGLSEREKDDSKQDTVNEEERIDDQPPIPDSDHNMNDEYSEETPNEILEPPKDSSANIEQVPDDMEISNDGDPMDAVSDSEIPEFEHQPDTTDQETKDQENEIERLEGSESPMDMSQSDREEGEVASTIDESEMPDRVENINNLPSMANQSPAVDEDFIERELDEALGDFQSREHNSKQQETNANTKNAMPPARQSDGNFFYDVYPPEEDNDSLSGDVSSKVDTSSSKQTDHYERNLDQTKDMNSDDEDNRLSKASGKRVQEDSVKPGEVKKRQKILESEESDKAGEKSNDKQDDQNQQSNNFRHVTEIDKGVTDMLDIAQEDNVPVQLDVDEEESEKLDEHKKDKSTKSVNDADVEMPPSKKPHQEVSKPSSSVDRFKELHENDKDGHVSETEEGEIKSDPTDGNEAISTFNTNYGLLNLMSDAANNSEWLKLLGNLNHDEADDDDVMIIDNEDEVEKAITIGWAECSRNVQNLVYQLCQQLQIVLKPTKMSKYKGDYRSGKRLNIRKIIPYIASQYRKDKIWLRRTKPNKRTYQIAIAVDDSRSMSENNCRLMAFQSLALLAKSLSLVEAGSLSILSFGETVKTLHQFDEPFTDSHGQNLLKQLTFRQKKTRYAHLLQECSEIFTKCAQHSPNQGQISQLLVIISDGRNVMQEGRSKVLTSLKNLKSLGVLTMFIIVDDKQGSQSIIDIKRAIVDQSSRETKIISYMEDFPFPFYVILRQVEYMPSVLGEGLRQWFELVSSS